jgi:Ca2+/H+ antiporter
MTDPLIADLDKDHQNGLSIISRGTAILLLGVYIAYLIFQLKTHASLFLPKPSLCDAARDVAAHPNEFPSEVAGDSPEMSVLAATLRCVHVLIPVFFFVQEFCSLLIVTIMTSILADYCRYQVAGSTYN